MTDIIVEFFRNHIGNDSLTIILIAILPIVELRGAIPVAFGMEFSPFMALFLSYIGSVIIVPFLLLLLRPILDLMKRVKIINKLAIAIEEVFQDKADKVVRQADKRKESEGELAIRYKLIGVLVFVAIPIPMTGVWTGSAIAVFLNLKFFPSLIAILVGNLCAGLIMTVLSLFFINYLDVILTILIVLIIAVLIIYIVTLLLGGRNDKKSN